VVSTGVVHYKGRHKGFLGVACAAVSLAVGVSGCGSGDPLAGQSGKQVLDNAVGNLKSASSFTMSGAVTESSGAYTVNLGYKPGNGCTGTVDQAGKGTLSVVVIGTTAWVKPDTAFWKATAGRQAGTVIHLIGGKYLKGSTSSGTVAGLARLCDVNSLAAQLQAPTDVAKGHVTTVSGTSAVPLTDRAKGGILYVTNASSPQVLQLVNGKAGSTGTISFKVGAPVTLVPPAPSQVVDGAKYGF
jgi:hypothetical protein